MSRTTAGTLSSTAGRWVVTAAVLGSGIVFLDSTLVNVALPQIGRELPASFLEVLEGQAYVYYAYLLSLSAFLILAGALADHYGRRRLFIIGLVGFALTSFLCGAAPSLELLVLFRILQGAAGAILVPGSLAIITATFEGEEQGKAFGLWAGASAATTILGPVVGGALVANVSWRAAFFINVPLLAIALFAAVRHLPESRDENAAPRFDWLGAGVVALAVGGLTLGPIRGQAQEWNDPWAYVALGVGAVAAIAFPFLMKRRSDPLVPLELFKSRNFSITNISTLLIYGALYVTFQYFALFAIGTLGYNELAFGIGGLPGTLFLVFLSKRFGALATRYGPRWFMAVGPAVMGLGLLWLGRIPADSEPWTATLDDPASLLPSTGYLVDVLPGFLVFGLGLAVMVAPLTSALMRSVPVDHSGLASAINNAISRVGPQLVGALLFIAISTSFYSALTEAGIEAGTGIRRELSPLNRPSPDVGPVITLAVNEASTRAFHLAVLVSAGLCFAGAAINAAGIKNEALHDTAEADSLEAQTA